MDRTTEKMCSLKWWLRSKISVQVCKCKRKKFLSFWYHCYYFTLSETYFILLETLLINHPSKFCLVLSPRKDGTSSFYCVLSPQKCSTTLVLLCAGSVERGHQFLLLCAESTEIQYHFSCVLCWVSGKMAPIPFIMCCCPQKYSTSLVLFCAGSVERWHQFLLLCAAVHRNVAPV